jgi:hypothetical protein
MLKPIVDDQDDETTTLPSGKKAVLPPPPGQSSPMYNAGSDTDSPNTDDFLKKYGIPDTTGLSHKIEGFAKEHEKQLEASNSQLNSRLDRDRAQRDRAFAAESADINAIPKMWDADKERQNRISDPIANFGSIGSIFALVASAFTKTPMTSALNGAAAAMNAIHEHDEEGYKSAYQAWKDNTELAFKRFDMERSLFEDTNKLIDTDINQWKVQTLAQAAQFDNKKVIAMLDAGLFPEIIEIQNSMIEGRIKGQVAKEKFEDYNAKHDVVNSMYQSNLEANPSAPQIPGANPKQQKEADRAYYKDHPASRPEFQALYRYYALEKVKNNFKNEPDKILNDAMLEAAAQGRALSHDEQTDILNKASRYGANGGGGAPTKQKEIYRRWQEAVKAHPEWGEDEKEQAYDQASRDVADASQPTMTPKMKVDTERNIDQYNEALTKIDTNIKSLEAHAAEAGLAGKATRMGERVGNVFGNNSTDREQFMRDIQFLRTGAQKLLFDRAGRPLAADADRINDIIGGLSAGDTTANTLRSLREVKKVLDRLKESQQKQLGGKWQAGDKPASGDDGGSTAKPAWEEAPIVGQ